MLARLIALTLLVAPILSSAEAAAQTPFDMTPEQATRPAAGAGGAAVPSINVMPPAAPTTTTPAAGGSMPSRGAAPSVAPFDIGEPPATPAPAPGAPPPAATPAEVAKIDRFIVPFASLRLNGEMDRQAWTISLTADEAGRSASIVVTYISSVLVMPEASRLLVTVNAQSVVETPLAASSQPARLSVAIPNGLLKTGPNLIQFQVTQRHRTDCTLASTYELWTEIDSAATGLIFSGGNPEAPASLDDLAAVGFDGKGDTNIRLVVPNRGEVQGGADLLRLVQAIALRGQYPHPVVTITDQADAPPALGTLAIAVGTAADLARIMPRLSADAVSRSPVFVRNNATGLTTLVVSGPTWPDVVGAINEIASVVERPLSEPRPTFITSSWLAPDVPIFLSGRDLDFSNLGIETQEFDGRRFHANFHIALPADFYANAYGEAEIYLDAAYTGDVKPGGHIDVSVNGYVAANVPLTSTSGDIFRRLPIKVPLTHFRPGVNEVEIEAVLETAADLSCLPGATLSGPNRFVLFDTSTFHLPNFARLARWPDLSAFGGTSFPYGRSEEPVAVVLGRSDPQAYSAAATLFARLAQNAGRIIPTETGVSIQAVGDRPAIFLGAIGEVAPSVLTQLGIDLEARSSWKGAIRPTNVLPGANGGATKVTDMPAPEPSMAPAEDTGEVFERWKKDLVNGAGVRGRWGAFEDWLQRTFDLSISSLRLTPVAEPLYRPPARASLLFAQGSSAGGGNWTLVTAPSADALTRELAAVTEVGLWRGLAGRVAAFQPATQEFAITPAANFHFIATQGVSFQNARLIAANWLSINILPYALALVLLCIVLGISTSALLARLGRRS